MTTDVELTPWPELTNRRRELLKTINSAYTPDDKFGTSDVSELLEDDDSTTTNTLNKLADKEDHYLKRVSTGGYPLLIAEKDHDQDESDSKPSDQEKLARKMVNEEGLKLRPEDYDWTDDDARNAFASKFNELSVSIRLIPTWTRNRYRLRTEASKTINNGYHS